MITPVKLANAVAECPADRVQADAGRPKMGRLRANSQTYSIHLPHSPLRLVSFTSPGWRHPEQKDWPTVMGRAQQQGDIGARGRCGLVPRKILERGAGGIIGAIAGQFQSSHHLFLWATGGKGANTKGVMRAFLSTNHECFPPLWYPQAFPLLTGQSVDTRDIFDIQSIPLSVSPPH